MNDSKRANGLLDFNVSAVIFGKIIRRRSVVETTTERIVDKINRCVVEALIDLDDATEPSSWDVLVESYFDRFNCSEREREACEETDFNEPDLVYPLSFDRLLEPSEIRLLSKLKQRFDGILSVCERLSKPVKTED